MRGFVKEGTKLVFLGMCVYGATDYCLPKEYASCVKSGKRLLYLTNLSLYLTILTLVLSYMVKRFGMKRLNCLYRDVLALSFSLEGIVTSLFWALISIDPVLVKNKELYDKGVRVSLLTEVSQHVVPIVLLAIDQGDVKLRKRRQCIYSIFVFSLLYFLSIWLYSTRSGGRWVYPVLNKMNMACRILFVTTAAVIGSLFYFCLLGINRLMYKETRQ